MTADATDLPALLERYERPLVRYSWSIIGDLESARDIVQETFIRLCRRQESGDAKHTEAWLFTVARNLSIDHQRKQSRIIYMPQTEDRTADAPAPGESLEQQEFLACGVGLYLCLDEMAGPKVANVGAVPGFIGLARLLHGFVSMLWKRKATPPADRSHQS